MPDPAITVRWVLFNDDWDRVVGNPTTTSPVSATERYLDYLAVSLESHRQRHPGTDHQSEVWLVAISEDGLAPGALHAGLERRGVRRHYALSVVGHRRAARFVEQARKQEGTYRSPNRLHEHLIFFALQECQTRWLAVFDPDIVFIGNQVIDRVVERLTRSPQHWAASFVEPGRERLGPDGPVRSRERMHTVALFFDAPALREHLPLRRFLERGPEEQLDGHPDVSIAEHYRRAGFRDSLSYLTEWLRHGLGADRLLDLGEVLGPVHEGPSLTLLSDGLLHWKYREPNAHATLEATLKQAGRTELDDPWVRLLLRAPPGPQSA